RRRRQGDPGRRSRGFGERRDARTRGVGRRPPDGGRAPGRGDEGPCRAAAGGTGLNPVRRTSRSSGDGGPPVDGYRAGAPERPVAYPTLSERRSRIGAGAAVSPGPGTVARA